jgi:hypothetical protein
LDSISVEEERIEINEPSKLLWHRRLGHFYPKDLTKYLNIHNVKSPKCLEYKIQGLNRKQHDKETPKTTLPIEVLYSDVIGHLHILHIPFNKK